MVGRRILKTFPTARRIGIIQPTSPALILVWLAALKAGKEPCFLQYPTEKISKDYWRDSIRHTIAGCQLEGLIHDSTTLPHQPGELAEALLIDGEMGELAPGADVISEGAIIQLSSGTTGHKKGVRITLPRLKLHVENYNQVMRLGADDTIVSWLPLYHDMGFIACFVMPLMLKVPIVMIDPMTWVRQPGTLFSAINKHRGTVCYMPNFGFEVMARQNATTAPDTMRHWISCSEPTYVQTLERFCQRTGARPETVSTCYGMAENVFAVSQSRGLKILESEDVKVVSCGQPIPGTQVKIVEGELCVKSDTSLDAYLGSEDVRDAEEFYATGDLGALIDGEIVISGRKRDVMISAGKKYFLNDLDFALGQILPDSAGRIAALADYDDALGTERVTFLVERNCFWETGGLQEISQKLKAAANLEMFQIHFVPQFFITKTSSGKINRKKTLQDWQACREWQTSGGARTLETLDGLSTSFQAKVEKSFSSLPKNAPLGSLLDSLGTVMMRLICEDHGLEYDPQAGLEELSQRLASPARKEETKVFSIVALVDGIKLGFGSGNGFITEEFIAKVAAEVGRPVSVEHVCAPPAQILVSDVIFHDYFMPRDLDGKYRAFSTVIQKIKNASLILIDDEDAFRLRDFCVYPRLSHRFGNDPQADLLAHRLAAYTQNHHLLAREVVPGKDLPPDQVTPSIRHLSFHLRTPIMKLAFHKQFERFTKDWDYTQYRNYVSDVDYQQNPVNAAGIQGAILQFIRARKEEFRCPQGVATPKLTLKDPPHFCSFLINRQAVDFIVGQYESFCIGGLPSSLPYLEQQLKKLGRQFFYASTINPGRTDFDSNT